MTDQQKKPGLSRDAFPGVANRNKAEKRFKFYGMAAIGLSLSLLFVVLVAVFINGKGAFFQTRVNLTVEVPEGDKNLETWRFRTMVRDMLKAEFPEASSRKTRRQLYGVLSPIADMELEKYAYSAGPNAESIPVSFTASDDVDLYVRHGDKMPTQLSELQKSIVHKWQADGRIEVRFNWSFFTNSDSRDPELAGVGGAIIGSLFTLLVCLVLSFVVGTMAAVYLEEFAPKNKWTALIEVNINNLAAVPSIIYGLLGLAIFLNLFGLPRSAALVGGMVLALMTMPTIIIASRVALQAVPPSIREAALGIGASRVQAVFHHVVPLALPGMLTGTIIGMARALGETAPLLMIGMVAFIADAPSSLMDPATAMPVQVYLWADSPERGFMEKTSGAIMVLLAMLVLMNGLAVYLRKKFEKRW